MLGGRWPFFASWRERVSGATLVNDRHEDPAMVRTEPFDLVLLDSSRLLDPTAILVEIRADPIPHRLVTRPHRTQQP